MPCVEFAAVDQVATMRMISRLLSMKHLKMKELIISHPNVMNFMGVCIDAGPTPYIVLPYMANGDLLSYVQHTRVGLHRVH